MQRVNYYTGQPVQDNLMLSDPMDDSAQYAMNIAEAYSYDPGRPAQMNYQQQGFMNPPVYGQPPVNPYQFGYPGPNPYSQLEVNGVPIQSPVQQPMGVMPMGYSFPQSGYMNMAPGFQGAPMNTPRMPMANPLLQISQPNPAFQPSGLGIGMGMTTPVGVYNPYTQQNMYYYNPQPQDKVVHVDGFNPSGRNYILPADIEDKCDQLQIQMVYDMEKEAAKKEQRIQGYFNANGMIPGYNYYGLPYYNPGYDQGVYNNYVQKIRDIANEAMMARRDFNKKLISCVNGYLGLGISEEEINKRICGYDYTIPGSLVQECYDQDRFSKLIPFDNSEYYRRMDKQISDLYRSVYTGDTMNDMLRDCGMLITLDKMEQQFHRNRDMSGRYSRSTYQTYLRDYALRQDMKEKEDEINRRQQLTNQVENGNFSNLPTNRDQAMELLYGPDVAARVNNLANILGGDHSNGLVPIGPPDTFGTPVMTIENAVEEEFAMRRNAFVGSILNRQSYADKNGEGE